MSERRKKTIRQAYEQAFGSPVRAEDRGARYETWANQRKQAVKEDEDKRRKVTTQQRLNERREKTRKPSSGGHGF